MKIAIDCMGSDKGPEVMVKGAVKGAKKHKDSELVLVGNESEIQEILNGLEIDNLTITIHNTTQVIKNDDKPIVAVRAKKDSSMVVASRMVSANDVDAFITAGSTGAYLTAGLLIIGRIKGIRRPALSAIIPSYIINNKEALLIDCGANMDATSDDLYNYAIMGEIYSRELMGRKHPRISLLNVGLEEGKGNKLVKETYEILKESDLNFIGNIEARTVFNGETDVVVCDGFSGNVAIKTFEGAAKALMGKLKEAIMSGFKSKIGALLLKSNLEAMKEDLDYNQYGGGVLLGLKGVAVKCHGSASELAVEVAFTQTYNMVKKNLVETIEEKLREKFNEEN
ncbi:MAG: phosphate acyltransferase PlsX [Clostridia bacterium]